MAGFNTAVTGLKAASTDLDVTGNNIANASTVGFKSSRTEFGDIYATAVVGAGSSNVAGSGVTVTDIAQDFQAGTIEFTNNNLDLAINGSGFFQLDDGQGGVTYTRAGSFELDKDGFIVSKSGKYLQGYGLDEQGNRLPIGNLAVTQKESPPKATESIDLSFNIDSRLDETKLLPEYNKDEPGSFTYSTTVRTFDSLGNEHTIKFNFVEQRPVNEIRTTTFDSDPTSLDISDVSIDFAADFDASGNLTSTRLAELQTADPRILLVSYDTASNELDVTFRSDSTQYGDLVIDSIAGGAAITATATDERPSNEVHTYSFEANGAGAFDASGNLISDVNFELGGVSFSFATGTPKSTIGEQLSAQQSLIIDRNPDVASVLFDSTTGEVSVTYKADVGNVANDLLQFADDATNSIFVDGAAADEPSSVVNGDNSYQGYYRAYAYLNGETQLELGKPNDPGESATLSDDGPILLRFNPTNGLLNEINGDAVVAGAAVPKVTIYGADPADPNTNITLDLENSTQFASASIVKASAQDGYTKGDLIGVTFGETGEMIASFSNGQNANLGVVAIATFENQSGLTPSGDTEWSATLTSGNAIFNPPGTGLNGTLRSAALEQSNVDLSAELVSLIEAQRNFQANSKTLETLNNVTQAILQI